MSEANEREWILSDNISGTSDSEGYWYCPQYPILISNDITFEIFFEIEKTLGTKILCVSLDGSD